MGFSYFIPEAVGVKAEKDLEPYELEVLVELFELLAEIEEASDV